MLSCAEVGIAKVEDKAAIHRALCPGVYASL